MGPSYRSGPGFCPTINATESQEILVAAGIKKAIRVKVHIIGVSNILQSDTYNVCFIFRYYFFTHCFPPFFFILSFFFFISFLDFT